MTHLASVNSVVSKKADGASSARGVLDGVKVVDFSRVFAGPAATQVLGDLGAEIVKIEPESGDEARYYGVTREELSNLGGISPSFLALNRNKQSIVLDLRNPKGKEIALRLVAEADVVVHNFRPGVMERLGFSYETLKENNPRLIYAEFSAYGTTGALTFRGANDLALQAHSGLISITGEADRSPVRCGSAIVDMHGSLALVSAILAALLQREKTGEGQRVESSLLMSASHLMSYFYTEYWMTGVVRKPMGTANHLTVPNQAFPARDGDVVIIASTDEMWSRCIRALDPEGKVLGMPAFARAFDRRANRVELVEALSSVTRTMTRGEVVAKLAEQGVVAANVNSVGEAADDRQLEEAGAVLQFEMPRASVRSVASPFAMSGAPLDRAEPVPALNEHAETILASIGYARSEIEELERQGAFGAARTASPLKAAGA